MDMTVLAYATVALSLFASAIKFGDWIIEAHRRLEANVSPEFGGTHCLKIDEARDVLLGAQSRLT